MRYAITLVVGIAVGFFIHWYGVSNLASTAQKGADSAVELAQESKFDSCESDFNKETGCRNDPKREAWECDKEVQARCGKNPRVKGKR